VINLTFSENVLVAKGKRQLQLCRGIINQYIKFIATKFGDYINIAATMALLSKRYSRLKKYIFALTDLSPAKLDFEENVAGKSSLLFVSVVKRALTPRIFRLVQ